MASISISASTAYAAPSKSLEKTVIARRTSILARLDERILSGRAVTRSLDSLSNLINLMIAELSM